MADNSILTPGCQDTVDVPTTVDEWVDCLKAFRDGGDLNGNGVDDEIPMATWFGATDTFGSYNLFYRFTGAFGCADSYCGGNAYADHLRLVDGKVTFTATDEAFKKTAEFFNMLYNEGLIWNGSFEADESASVKQSLIKEDVARIGSFGVWGDQEITNLDVHDEYVAVPRLEGEAGKTGFAVNYSQLQDSSNTAITTTCKFPHVVARFVDYLVSDPVISVTGNWGPYNYAEDENGKEDILAEYETIPRVQMTQEELQRLAQIQPPVSDIVDRYINTWVTTGFSQESWDAYISELEGAGVNDIVNIYQTAYDRANAAIQ